jgi:hypothetical protein
MLAINAWQFSLNLERKVKVVGLARPYVYAFATTFPLLSFRVPL